MKKQKLEAQAEMLLYSGPGKGGVLHFYDFALQEIRKLQIFGAPERGAILAAHIAPGASNITYYRRVKTNSIPVRDLDPELLDDLQSPKRFGFTFMGRVLSAASPRIVFSAAKAEFLIREVDVFVRSGDVIRQVKLTLWGKFLTDLNPAIGEICLVVNSHSEVYNGVVRLSVGEAGFIQYDVQTLQAVELNQWFTDTTEDRPDLILPDGVEFYEE